MKRYSKADVVIKKKTITPDNIEWELLWFTDGAEESYRVTIDESVTESHLEMWAVDEHTDELYLHTSFDVNTRGKLVDFFNELDMVPDCLGAIGFTIEESVDHEGWY